MRLHELIKPSLCESEINSIETQIINLLSALSAEGITSVDTIQLVSDLQDMGFYVDVFSVLDVLDGMSMIASANSETIEIKSASSDPVSDDNTKQQAQDKVDSDAQHQATSKRELSSHPEGKPKLDVKSSKKQQSNVDKAARQQATKDMR